MNEPAKAPVATNGDMSTGGKGTRRATRRNAEAASATAHNAQQAADAAMREQHSAAMHQNAFFQAPLQETHAYRNEASTASHQNTSYAQRNKAIMKQVRHPCQHRQTADGPSVASVITANILLCYTDDSKACS